MPRLTKIYTRKGDDGTTGLGGGQRVPKDDPRVAAYGTVDELNSHLGHALSGGLTPRLAAVVPEIQNVLFHLGADLSFREEDKAELPLPKIEARHVSALEDLIDELGGVTGPLANFILPGGAEPAARLHIARTVCRRAERDVIALRRLEPIGEYALAYLNRLSDALFVMARYENVSRGVPEPLWDSRA